jgi:hypothetical protein
MWISVLRTHQPEGQARRGDPLHNRGASSWTTTSSNVPSGRSPSFVKCTVVGSDDRAEHRAMIASLIETCRLIGVEPYCYLAATFAVQPAVQGCSTFVIGGRIDLRSNFV